MAARNVGRSILAGVTGVLTVVVLSTVTDLLLVRAGVLPALGRIASDGVLLLATAYRTLYGVLASYVTARLAPSRPMLHAMVLGCIGVVVNLGGVVADWNGAMGSRWYPWALVVLALPQSWLGGWIRKRQESRIRG